MRKRKIQLTTQFAIIVCALLLAVSIVFGVVLMSQSGKTLRTMMRRHMLSVADTAAATLDGDKLGSLTKEDFDTKSEAFRKIYDQLTSVMNAQEDTDIKYIYAVTKDTTDTDGDGRDRFIFTVDPDPEDPGEFGKEVVFTPSQSKAWNEGRSYVDEQIYEDEWGKFYSAWSPVKNSRGEVVGLVAVDFVADWYEHQQFLHSVSVVIISSVSLAVGAFMMFFLTRLLRRRIYLLNAEILTLSRNVEALSREIRVRPGEEPENDGEGLEFDSDSIGALSGKIRVMQTQLKEYLDYVREQAYTDTMTGVENKTAYLEYVKELNQKINEGVASFAVAVFDVNGLKKTNDNFGHECGDRIIIDAAAIIRRVFGDGRIFRIGGDEFIAILGFRTEEELNASLDALQKEVAEFNANEKKYSMTLSFSGGGAVYVPGVDSAFKEVFKRADETMYRNKANYYIRFGDRRRRRDDAPKE